VVDIRDPRIIGWQAVGYVYTGPRGVTHGRLSLLLRKPFCTLLKANVGDRRLRYY